MVHDTILVDQETKSENDFQEKSRDAGLPEVILLTYPPRFPALVDRYTETPPGFPSSASNLSSHQPSSATQSMKD
jgi:hypothetical protein